MGADPVGAYTAIRRPGDLCYSFLRTELGNGGVGAAKDRWWTCHGRTNDVVLVYYVAQHG